MYLLQNQHNTIFTLGESLLDLVTSDGKFFHAVAGGSVLNASVTLSRLGASVMLISEFGKDAAGILLNNFLTENRIDSKLCIRYPANKTALALAFLDNEKKASYSFYLDAPETIQHYNLPDFYQDDFLLFGSIYSVKPQRLNYVESIIIQAINSGVFIYFDPNIRKSKPESDASLLKNVKKHLHSAHVVKGSVEDFYELSGTQEPEQIYSRLSEYCKNLIITSGAGPVHVFTPAFHLTYQVPAIHPVSTIGAGDNFNAGFLAGCSFAGFTSNKFNRLQPSDWDVLMAFAIGCATKCCLSESNYIDKNIEPEFWKSFMECRNA